MLTIKMVYMYQWILVVVLNHYGRVDGIGAVVLIVFIAGHGVRLNGKTLNHFWISKI